MELIRGTNISFRFGGQSENLLDKVSFSVDGSSRIGLVGDNGCGKTTLLEILRGNLKVSKDELNIGKEVVLGHLPQEVRFEGEENVRDYLWQASDDLHQLKKRLMGADDSSVEYAELISRFYNRGGGEFDGQIEKVLAGFDIGESKLDLPVSKLSGGEKTKIALARILLRRPDVMLLDEPTNHLEIASLEWLEDYLLTGTLPYVVVSHDRRFLDNCIDEIWELKGRKLSVISGNYSFYKKEKELGVKRQHQEYENQQKNIKQLKAAANQRRRDASKMEKFKPSRSVSKKGAIQKRDDGSGRSGASSADKMRSAKAVEKRIQIMLEKEKAEKPRLDRERKITFSASPIKAPVILKVRKLDMSFGGRSVFKNLNLTVGNGGRLGIIGRNGSGKSTFLKIITDNLRASSGSYKWTPQAEIGYFSQELETLEMSSTILDEVLQGRHEEQTRARTILGRLNIRRDKVYQTIETLSMGERSKAALAKILFSDANILVLDEPTNHIELSAREAFEDALEDFQGTVIVVSHDRYLLERVTSEIFDIEGNRYFGGGYSEYLDNLAVG